jgi:hypothetical protein
MQNADRADTTVEVVPADTSKGRDGSPIEATTADAEFRGVGRLGDVAFEGAQGSVKLDETNGEISVAAARGASASLDAGTTYGRIHNTLRNTDGAAGLNLHATTAYGDITARSL